MQVGLQTCLTPKNFSLCWHNQFMTYFNLSNFDVGTWWSNQWSLSDQGCDLWRLLLTSYNGILLILCQIRVLRLFSWKKISGSRSIWAKVVHLNHPHSLQCHKKNQQNATIGSGEMCFYNPMASIIHKIYSPTNITDT